MYILYVCICIFIYGARCEGSFISILYPRSWEIGEMDTFLTFASLCAGLCGGVTVIRSCEEPSVPLRPPSPPKNSSHILHTI